MDKFNGREPERTRVSINIDGDCKNDAVNFDVYISKHITYRK